MDKRDKDFNNDEVLVTFYEKKKKSIRAYNQKLIRT